MIQRIFPLAIWWLFFGVLNQELFARITSPLREERADQLITKAIRVQTSRGEVHFEVHGHANRLTYINRVAEVLREKSRPILEYFEYPPIDSIHFVLDPKASRANGSAQVFPYPLIHLNLFPPFGNSHLLTGEDWIQNLVLHELVHVVHMDQTRGLVKGLRRVFGNFATLLTSVNPRWFSEGIAVWAETEFSKGGRLRQELALFETHSRVLERSFCATIDCLDEPGQYPYGSFPYWIGSLFLNEKEEEKPGLIACMVKKNSDQLPFFVATAYQRCMGSARRINDDFEKFISKKRQSLERARERLKKSPLVKIEGVRALPLSSLGTPIYQKNFRVRKGKLLYVVDKEATPIGIIKDLRSGEERELDWNFHVDQISSAKGSSFLVSTSTRNRFWEPRQIAWINSEQGLVEKVLELEKGADYPLQGRGDLYFFRYQEDSWILYRWSEGRERELLKLPGLSEISRVRLIQIDKREFISFLLYDGSQKKPYQLWSVQTREGIPRVLYRSSHPFDFLEQCGNQFFLKQDRRLMALESISNNRTRLRLSKRFWGEQIVQLRWDDEDTVLLLKDDPSQAYHLPKGCREVSRILLRGAEREKWGEAKAVQVKPRVSNFNNLKNYPKLSHFKPHWWFINYSGGDQTSVIGAMTSLSDPISKHRFDLDLNYYPQIDERTLNVDYTYTLYENRDYWENSVELLIDLGHRQAYVETNLRTGPDADEMVYAGFTGAFRNRAFNYSFSLIGSREKSIDFVSTREFFRYSWNHGFSRSSVFARDFLTKLGFGHEFFWQQTKGGKDFWGHIFFTRNTLQPMRRFYLHMLGSYGKNRKTNFNDGVFFGGGTNNELFPFYGIGSNNAFGNEITTYRFQLDAEVWRIYRSFYTFPLYFKKINLIAGTDYLKTDFIYIKKDESFLRKREVVGQHLGIRSTLTLFYWLPVEADFIVNKLKNEYGSDETDSLVILNTSLLF